MDVFFDNLQITHEPGPLLETNEYYPFGLLMKNISYRSQRGANFAENKYKFNAGTELNEALDLQYYETPLRNYDPQIGRFNCIDILAEQYFALTPYQFGFNNPVYFNDPTGALTKAEFENLLQVLWGNTNGGHWSADGDGTGSFSFGGGSIELFGSSDEAFGAAAGMMAGNGWWGLQKGWATDFLSALNNYNGGKLTDEMMNGYYIQQWSGQQAYNITTGYSRNGKGFTTLFSTEYTGTMNNINNVYTSVDNAIQLFGGYFGDGNNAQNGRDDWMNKTQTGLEAFDLAHGAKEELINYAAKASPAINELKYTKAVKVASKGVFAAQAGISLYQTYSAFKNKDSNAWGVTGKAALDVTIGYLSLVGGPAGWVLGAVYFIGDAAGWWGNWGEPTYSSYHIKNP
ncbi:MAG TPA: RHS repeat-associated core domain-containing protein [Ferruginibacter sp.]|nr:RHS repeat-associated core domain-containing protein [Ferruginibacter sp.]